VNEKDRMDLGRYFDGELTGEDRERIELQLTRDPDARRHVEQLEVLRKWARAHEPSSLMPATASPILRPWHDTTRRNWRPLRFGMGAAAAAAAAVLFSMWWMNRFAPLPSGNAGVSPRGVNQAGPAEPIATVQAEPTLASEAPVASDFDAQRFAWANGELPSPTVAARAVLDHRPRHGVRPPHVEILAIELAHAQPGTTQEFARELVERSASMRQSPTHARPVHKAAAPADAPQGSFRYDCKSSERFAAGKPRSWHVLNRDPRGEIL
jgi:hypothetical protein